MLASAQRSSSLLIHSRSRPGFGGRWLASPRLRIACCWVTVCRFRRGGNGFFKLERAGTPARFLLAGYSHEGRGQELAQPQRAALASVKAGARELRRHRVEAARVALPLLRPVEGLAEIQEPGRACGETGSGGGLTPYKSRLAITVLAVLCIGVRLGQSVRWCCTL